MNIERTHVDQYDPGYVRWLEAEIDRRDQVLVWLAENMPRALELCPYKLADSNGDNRP